MIAPMSLSTVKILYAFYKIDQSQQSRNHENKNKNDLDTEDSPRLVLKGLLFNLIGEETLALNQKHLVMMVSGGSGTFIP